MGTTLDDILAEQYEMNLYRDLDGLIPNSDRYDYAELISTIFTIHIYIESLIKKTLTKIMTVKFNIQNPKKINTIIEGLSFDNIIALVDSLEITNKDFIKYLKELNSIRNKLAHENDINNITFFGKKIFSIGSFEKLKEKTDFALSLLKPYIEQ